MDVIVRPLYHGLAEFGRVKPPIGFPTRIAFTFFFFLFSHASAQQKQIKSKNADFYESRGLSYLEKCQYDKALLYFNKALKMNPADAYAYWNRGRVYGEQGQYNHAISDYAKALEINPTYGNAYFYRGLAYHASGIISLYQISNNNPQGDNFHKNS